MSDRELRSSSPPLKRRKLHAPRPAPMPSTQAPAHTQQSHVAPPQQPSQLPNPPPPPQIFRFPIQPLHRFQGSPATVKRPVEVAHFSYDEKHEYRDDDSGICYYHPPEIGTNLCDGFDTFRHFEEKEDPHLDSLLRALASREKARGERVEADFVTWRGMMTKILTAPFDTFAEFSMRATRLNKTIYLEENFPARLVQRAAEPPRPSNPHLPSHAMMTYWGYKFETLSMLPVPPGPEATPASLAARKTATVSNYAQHCSIVRTQIGRCSLILGGEVDGLLRPKLGAGDKEKEKEKEKAAEVPWLELKTAEELPPPQRRQHRDILKYERKLLKFWAQSFLLGVPKVIVGFRSKHGILRGLEKYDTAKIPGMVRRGTGCWDGSVCVNFAAAFLETLRAWMGEAKEGGVWKIELRKRAGVIEVERVEEKGTGGIVSEEFLAWRRQKEDGNEAVEEEMQPQVHDGEGKVAEREEDAAAEATQGSEERSLAEQASLLSTVT